MDLALIKCTEARPLTGLLVVFCIKCGCAFNTPPPFRYVDSDPIFSPNGEYIGFLGPDPKTGHGTDRMWIMDEDGSNRKCLAPKIYAGARPMWSPDGKNLLFLTALARHWRPIFKWEFDWAYCEVSIEDQTMRFIHGPDRYQCIGFHPNGKQLIWAQHWPNESMWLSDLNGEDLEMILPTFNRHDYSASDDWSRAVFGEEQNDEWNIFVAFLEDKSMRVVKNAYLPSISGDGELIAYVNTIDSEIVIETFAGDQVCRVKSSEVARSSRKIMFSRDRLTIYSDCGSGRICAIDTETGNVTWLPIEGLYYYKLYLTPDRRHFYCHGGPRMSNGIYKVPVDGTKWTRLSPYHPDYLTGNY